MGLLHIWKGNLKNKFQIFSWVLCHLKIGNILTKAKIQVARKFPMWVFKTTAFEQRSQQNNPKRDQRSPYRKILHKLFKFAYHVQVYKFEHFLDDFSVQ